MSSFAHQCQNFFTIWNSGAERNVYVRRFVFGELLLGLSKHLSKQQSKWTGRTFAMTTSMRRARRRLSSIVAIGSVLIASTSVPALATSTTATIAVTATALSSCLVIATPLAFGNYSATGGSATDATSTVTATCTSGTPYTLALDSGTTSGSTVAARALANALDSKTLTYGLYTTSGHTTSWGDGTASTVTQGATSTGLPAAYTVYGEIPAHQYVTTGAYTDTVTVTLAY
jgi:spore coat protein U-like protein